LHIVSICYYFFFRELACLLVLHFQNVYGDSPPNTDLSFILFTTVADGVTSTSDSYEQQPDERDVSSNVSHSDVMDGEDVDVKEEEEEYPAP